MLRNSKIISVAILILVSALMPQLVFASLCSKEGYTIETVNGIFTDEIGAKKNSDALKYYFEKTYHGEPLTIDFLLNKTHGKVLDVTDVAIQKTFEGVNMWDPDFLKILSDASTQVKTQKLLLVSHSQGNFYANNVYKVVTDSGDVSKKSIGVYGVASPASYVPGEGRHRTSSTDKVIAFLVENVLPGKIAPTNDTIDYKWADDSGKGHGFSEIYLRYRSQEIVDDIKWSLDKLSLDPTRSENTLCINPPKELSTLVKIVQPAVYVAKTVVVIGATGATTVKNTAVGTVVGTYHIAVNTAVWTYHTAVATAKWTYNTTVAVAVWGYDTATAVAKTAWGVASTIGSFTYNVLTGALSNNQVENNNSASVILATIPPVPVQNLPTTNTTDNNVIAITTTTPVENQSGVINAQQPSQQPQTVFVFEPKVQNGTNVPKLVFVGSFSTGGGSAQVMGTQSTAPASEELAVLKTEEEIADNEGTAMAVPALSAPQCAQTLATDGCLLATTTVHFEWPDVAGADHYLLNKNGEYATTTEKSFDAKIKDFSSYIFEVVAVGADSHASATSTQIVSVATIPIAINEIAWMGTVASTTREWFEIKNNTAHVIDLSQWELNAKDGTPHIKLTGVIAPRAYLIFERIDDTTVRDVDMHKKFTGALVDTGDQLTLSYASTTMDQTPWGAWPAGATSTRQTMERYSSREPGTDPENWGTNLGYIKNGTDANGNAIEGTPGAQNSVSTLINKGQDITSDFTLTADEERYVIANTLRVSASSTLTIEPGVEIKFYGENSMWPTARMDVYGALSVQGTSENPVVLGSFDDTPSGAINFWYTTSTSTIDYAHIENTRGLRVQGASTTVEISNTEFSGNAVAIELYGGAYVSLSSSTIKDTFYSDAIGVYYSTMAIASSTIENTLKGDAIGVYYSNVAIASTTIDGVPNRNGIFSHKSVLDIENSIIRNTEDDAIILSNSTSTITSSIVEGGELNKWSSGIYISKGTATITDTSVSGFSDGSGVYVDKGILSISSSTIKNVADYGIYAYKATTTISNVTVENGGINGVEINQGTATIADTSISGFTEGAGISVSLNRKGNWQEMEAVPGIVANISNSEITGNAIGVEMEVGSAIIGSDVSVQENTKNIVVCSLVGECVEQ